MEYHAEAVKAETGEEIAVYGFDTGKGVPPPQDYRDLPYLFNPVTLQWMFLSCAPGSRSPSLSLGRWKNVARIRRTGEPATDRLHIL